MKANDLRAPAMITWQLTRDCDLACLHCCTESAPGRALPGELGREQALGLAAQILESGVPYVMLAGGEPLIVEHFWELAETLGRGGAWLKVETNGQRFGAAEALRLSRLPIRSVQVSIDGATEETYQRMRPGGSLEAAKEACRSVRRAGLGLEVTYAPARLNLHEAEAVIVLALELGAFRLNTGRLMRLGTAAKLWGRLALSEREHDNFYRLLERREAELAGRLELCFRPFSLAEELREREAGPSGALLILPDGRVKVAGPLPYVCADLKRQSLAEAWRDYLRAWKDPRVLRALREAGQDEESLARANQWEFLDLPVSV